MGRFFFLWDLSICFRTSMGVGLCLLGCGSEDIGHSEGRGLSEQRGLRGPLFQARRPPLRITKIKTEVRFRGPGPSPGPD